MGNNIYNGLYIPCICYRKLKDINIDIGELGFIDMNKTLVFNKNTVEINYKFTDIKEINRYFMMPYSCKITLIDKIIKEKHNKKIITKTLYLKSFLFCDKETSYKNINLNSYYQANILLPLLLLQHFHSEILKPFSYTLIKTLENIEYIDNMKDIQNNKELIFQLLFAIKDIIGRIKVQCLTFLLDNGEILIEEEEIKTEEDVLKEKIKEVNKLKDINKNFFEDLNR